MFHTIFYSVVFTFCSTTLLAQTATLSGNLERRASESIRVLLYPEFGYGNGYLGSPVDSLSTHQDSFSLSVDPGKYVLAVFGAKHDPLIVPVVLPQPGSQENLTVELAPLSIQEPVNSVKVFGAFCEWKQEKGIPMAKEGTQWVLQNDTLMEEGSLYRFVINDKFTTHMPTIETEFSPNDGKFNHVYQDQPIILDPEAFSQHDAESTAVWGDTSINPKYKSLIDSLVTLQPFKRNLMRQLYQGAVSPDETKTYLEKFQQIKQQYEADFGQILLEEQIENIRLEYPELQEILKLIQENTDSLELKAHFQRENYQKFLTEMLMLTDQLDPQSYLLKGEFADFLATLDQHLESSGFLRERYNLQPDHFYQFLMNFVNTSPDEEVSESILFRLGYHYTFAQKTDIAETVLLKLKNEYPNGKNVKAGYVDQQLKGLKVSVGADAPEFAVLTTAGDSLRLSDLAGKYVFIDFWGTWCGPCIQEIPNVKALTEAFSPDLLQVVGLAQDRPESLSEYVQKEALPYPNAIAMQAVQDYGITAFPTTFLIGPDGKIIGKNLRGEHLVTHVEENIRKYEEKSSTGN